MCSGVGKSGSPAPKPTTSLPSAFICLNSESMTSVVDACTPAAILEIGFNATLTHSFSSLYGFIICLLPHFCKSAAAKLQI